MFNEKVQKINRRHKKIRARVTGSATKPRLAVSKSNRNIIAQLINDEKGETLAYAWTKLEKGDTLHERSVSAGKTISELANTKKISKVVFDRGGYKYIGNIKLLADAARDGGLEF